MSAPRCANCAGPKPDDRFRACPQCRADWRRTSRKPGGPAETIETMAEALRRAERKLTAYVGVCSGDKELTGTVLPMVRAALAAHDRSERQ